MHANIFKLIIIGNLICIIFGQNKYVEEVRLCFLKPKSEMESCLLQFWLEIKSLAPTGIPELNIPPLDPLHIPKLEAKDAGTEVKGTATFTDVVVVGVMGNVPKSVKVDTANKLIKIEIEIPFLRIKGIYSVNGNAMSLPIKGQGPFSLNLTEITSVAIDHLDIKDKLIKGSHMEVDFNIKTMKLDLGGSFGGEGQDDPSLGEAINNMLNENSQALLQDVKPTIRKIIGEYITNMLSGTFVDLPADNFL